MYQVKDHKLPERPISWPTLSIGLQSLSRKQICFAWGLRLSSRDHEHPPLYFAGSGEEVCAEGSRGWHRRRLFRQRVSIATPSACACASAKDQIRAALA
jgi:hypothetical protein